MKIDDSIDKSLYKDIGFLFCRVIKIHAGEAAGLNECYMILFIGKIKLWNWITAIYRGLMV